ncbi:enoyl-CoA hydratase, partial [Pontibacterium sp.]|uniref:enoyl-CoA hydratase n=1 Tax=Pontibacterium sp. TaxID=2036026 RepID=UPI0035163A9D
MAWFDQICIGLLLYGFLLILGRNNNNKAEHTMSEHILLREDRDGICFLSLNRPDAYNALSLELMEALIQALDAIAEDSSVRVVVIRGNGKGFCAGHDLKQMLGEGTEEYYQQTFDTCGQMMQRVVSLPVPVIAQVHGVATAAGCQLVASCDLAVSTDSSRFATPGVNIGLFCSTPMVALTRTVAPKHAMEMLLLGDLIDAGRAEQMGLINWAVPADKLEETVLNVAGKIASKSRKALSMGKQAFHNQREQVLSD